MHISNVFFSTWLTRILDDILLIDFTTPWKQKGLVLHVVTHRRAKRIPRTTNAGLEKHMLTYVEEMRIFFGCASLDYKPTKHKLPITVLRAEANTSTRLYFQNLVDMLFLSLL